MQALCLAQVKGLSDLWLSSRDHKHDTFDPKQYGPAFMTRFLNEYFRIKKRPCIRNNANHLCEVVPPLNICKNVYRFWCDLNIVELTNKCYCLGCFV